MSALRSRRPHAPCHLLQLEGPRHRHRGGCRRVARRARRLARVAVGQLGLGRRHTQDRHHLAGRRAHHLDPGSGDEQSERNHPGATASTTGATASTPSTAGSPGTASGPLSTKPVVTVPSGPPPTTVQIKEIIVGTGPEAKAPARVTVNYVGVLYNGGAEFDSSWRRGARFTFTMGTGQVITGWNEGVAGMKVGGRRELIVPASFAYGAKGLETRPVPIPPNAALVFVVDLLKV